MGVYYRLISLMGTVKAALLTNTKSLVLDGVNQYMSVPDSNDLSFGDGVTDNPFTISTWIKPTLDTGFDDLITKPTEYQINISTSYLYFKLMDNSVNIYIRARLTINNTELKDGNWHHVTCTYDGSGVNSGLKVYIDGSLYTTVNNSLGSYTAMDNLGGDVGIGDTTYSGNIDQTILWDKELTFDEIRELIQLRDLTQHSAYANIVSWWEFDDEDITGTTVADRVGINDGTLINGATNTVCIPYPYLYQLEADNYTSLQNSDGGWSWDFDGSNDSIDITTGGGATLTEGSTSIWMKFDFAKTHGGVDGVYTLYIDGTNYIQLFYQVSVDAFDFRYNGGGSIRTARVNYEDMPPRGSWFNIILTYSITDDEAKILINGVEKASVSSLTAMTGSISSVNFGSLGAVTGYNGLYKITDVCNFNKALSAAEALEIFNNNQPRNEMNESLSGDIVGYWRGRNSSIGTGSVLDMSTNSNNGTMVNMTETDVVYQYPRTAFDLANGNEGSFKFDGSAQYVNVPNSSDLTFTNGSGTDSPFTVAFWINSDDIAYNSVITKSTEFAILANSSSQYYLKLFSGRSNTLSVRTDTSYTAGKWQFIAMTYDGNGAVGGVGSIVVYLDGDEGSSTDEGSAGTYAGMNNSGTPIQIGITLDEMNMNGVTFFNRVLTGCEVRELYNSGSPISISNFTASATAISHWRMDATDDPTGTVTDTVGSNNGTAISMTAGSLETDNYPTN